MLGGGNGDTFEQCQGAGCVTGFGQTLDFEKFEIIVAVDFGDDVVDAW